LVALVVWRQSREAKPKLFCGAEVASIVQAVPTLHERLRLPILLPLGVLQLIVLGVQMHLQELLSTFTFEREEIEADLNGSMRDTVALAWLRRSDEDELPAEAPIVLVCPGLCCTEYNLPGTHLYRSLLRRPFRVAVFLKRGIASAKLRAPAVHIFGHPTDLRAALDRIVARHPTAPVHVVSYSSGNGLAGSFAALHDDECPAVRSYCLLCGGCDFRSIYPSRPLWPWTWALFSWLLVPSVHANLLAPHEATLAAHDAPGYAKVRRASTIQALYDAAVEHFSGYGRVEEAEAQTNGFRGGNACAAACIRTPYLHVYTEDDPISPGGPEPEWLGNYARGSHTACALFPHGSHLACYDSLDIRTRWVDRLVVEWIEAVSSKASQ